MRLTVAEAFQQDVYKDTARIHRMHRRGLASGRLARVSVEDGEDTIVAVRGLDNADRDRILLDLETRRRLAVKLGQSYEFRIDRKWPWQKLSWALNASDPAARIATWIAVLSFVLGTFLGLVGIWISLR